MLGVRLHILLEFADKITVRQGRVLTRTVVGLIYRGLDNVMFRSVACLQLMTNAGDNDIGFNFQSYDPQKEQSPSLSEDTAII